MSMGPRGLIIAAPSSGSGKTTVTLGLLRELRRQGVSVQPFKCGPDYIDAAFHTAAAGRQSINLDTWAMRHGVLDNLVRTCGADADICVVEGVMGLFDGAAERGQCGNGSTADLAALTGWPVVLVLDVAGQAETAAAVALGCQTYRNDVRIAGVILNMTAGERHERLVATAIERLGLPVFGSLRRNENMKLADRHLGLVQAVETGNLERRLNEIADAVAAGVRSDRIVAAASPFVSAAGDESSKPSYLPVEPPGQRIALASDPAFSFIYPHLLAGWRSAGAEIAPFSPLADEAPCQDCDAVWLPGGYPELHGPTLAGAHQFRAGVRAVAGRGVPIHGECGGYMVLGAGLQDADGTRHEMLGLLGLETSFAKRRLHLGYRCARYLGTSPAGSMGATLYGHEFHYATVLVAPDSPLADIVDAGGIAVADRGSRRGSVTGTFFHVIDRAP